MRTTRKDGAPRILVRISGQQRTEKLEKEIITKDGRRLTLYLVAPADEELKKFELAVETGIVEAVGPGAEGFQVGDQVLLDYVVDTDDQYLVHMDGRDKIVSVPCVTTFHNNSQSVTSYGHRLSETQFNYTGERNMLIWDQGDVNQLGMVYGVIRGTDLIPSDYWVFCEYQPDRSEQMQASGGIFAYRNFDNTYVKRKVMFAAPGHEFSGGDYVLAVEGAAKQIQVLGVDFDVIALPDIWGVEK